MRASVPVAKTVQTKCDASTLHSNPPLAAQMQMVDDGTGKREVLRVKGLELVPVEMSDHGKFFSGACYVIVYVYDSGSKDECVIYYWLGQNAPPDDKVTAAGKALELDDRFNNQAVLVRINQGKETPHFMVIFSGQMIVFGGVATEEGRACNGGGAMAPDWVGYLPDVYLLRVHGSAEHNTKAVQVPCNASSLNSGDVFLLFAGSTVHLWAGRRSTGDEREMAKKIATNSAKEMILVSEGQEKQDFWDAIGGKLDYNNEKLAEVSGPDQLPRNTVKHKTTRDALEGTSILAGRHND